MTIIDLPELAQDANLKESLAIDVAGGGAIVVIAACHAILGRMSRIAEHVGVGAVCGEDFDSLLAELMEVQGHACQIHHSIGKALRALHRANRAATAASTLDFLQTTEAELCAST